MRRTCFLLCPAALLSCLLFSTPGPGQKQGGKQRPPDVITHLSFSPDGKRLVATYYAHARNRPGTDWAAFGVVWDLETGKRTVMPQAIGPAAISADGKTLAIGTYDPKVKQGGSGWPQIRLALMSPDTGELVRTLDAPGEAQNPAKDRGGTVVTFVLHPDGKHIVVASAGSLWWQALDGRTQPRLIATLLDGSNNWDQSQASHLTFQENGTVLEFKGMVGEGGKKGRSIMAVTLRVDPANRAMPFKEVSRRPATKEEEGLFAVKPGAGKTVTSPDGRKRAVATANGLVEILDARTGQVIRKLQAID
jgi:WD40 repeat protein